MRLVQALKPLDCNLSGPSQGFDYREMKREKERETETQIDRQTETDGQTDRDRGRE